MSALVDTTVLIDHLRGNAAATRIPAGHRSSGEVGRAWLPSHRGFDDADLAIAATAAMLDPH